MKKKYLKTVEELVALKDTDTKIYAENVHGYYQFVNGVWCGFDDECSSSWSICPLTCEEEELYILEEEPMQEASEKDIGKLCLFWDYGTDENAKKDEIHLLLEIKKNEKGRTEYWCDGCGENGFYHCRRATPSEVAEITGYGVTEDGSTFYGEPFKVVGKEEE